MSRGPVGALAEAPWASYGSMGPAPTAPGRTAGVAAWNAPAPPEFFRPPGGDGASDQFPAAAPTVRIPSLSRRIAFGALRLLPLLALYVVFPYLGFQGLTQYGLVEGLPLSQVLFFGVGLAILSTAAYVARPTRAFGPLSTASSLAKVAYLLYFAGFAWAAVSVSTATVRLDFGTLLELLALVPAFGVAAGVLTTVQDVRHPGERLRFDYPA